MYLLDTNVCVGFLKGNRSVGQRLSEIPTEDINLCAVVKAELYYGVRASQQIARNLATLEAFLTPYMSLVFDDRCAGYYGQLRADLRRTGQPIGPNDMMIAATALANDLALVTHNTREFSRVPGLKLEDWET